MQNGWNFQNSTERLIKRENTKWDRREINKNIHLIRVLERETREIGRGKIYTEKAEYIPELMKDMYIQI